MKTAKITFLFVIFSTAFLPAAELNRGFITGFSGSYSSVSGPYGNTFKATPGFGALVLYYPSVTGIFFESNFSYTGFSMNINKDSTLDQYILSAGPGFYFPLTRWLEPYVSLQGGINHMRFNFKASSESSNSSKAVGIAGAGFTVSPFDYFSFRLGGAYSMGELSGKRYSNIILTSSAVMRMNVFTARNILEKKESSVVLSDMRLRPLYGAQYAIYGNEGVGRVQIRNVGREPVTDVRVDALISEISSGPTSSRIIKMLQPGQAEELDVPLLISKEILSVTESRDLPLKLRAFYKSGKGVFSYIETVNIKVHSRNSIVWNNTAHIGSFITPLEETASGYARSIVSFFKQRQIQGFNRRFQEAMAVFDTLGAAGISYATDPNTGFGKLGAEAIDYVMFSRETLGKRAGDCDDLTVLYSTLLESIGIRTAIVTIPGHVFMMFDTEVPGISYTDITEDRSLVHILNDSVWIPVEITMIGKSFMSAWKEGAAAVEKYSHQKGALEVIETMHAWNKFPPADIGTGRSMPLPDREKIEILLNLDMDHLKTAGFENQTRRWLSELERSPRNYRALNSLGVLYAKFGKFDEAMNYFRKASEAEPGRASSYANTGNIYLIQKKFDEAVKMFERAVGLSPDNHKLRIGLARAYYEAGKKFNAKNSYAAAVKQYPGYSKKYSYLDSDPSVRAADPGERIMQGMWSD